MVASRNRAPDIARRSQQPSGLQDEQDRRGSVVLGVFALPIAPAGRSCAGDASVTTADHRPLSWS